MNHNKLIAAGLILTLGLLLTIGCFGPFAGEDGPTDINQGIYGEVTLITGNCMPSPASEDNNDCEYSSVSRKIYIRETATTENMNMTYLDTETTLVKTTESDNNGQYQVELPPGNYSVFVEDKGKEYCKRITGDGEACPITIEENKTKEYDIEIDHAAW